MFARPACCAGVAEIYRALRQSPAIHPLVCADRRIFATHGKSAGLSDAALHRRRKELSDYRFWMHWRKTSLGDVGRRDPESTREAKVRNEGHSPRYREVESEKPSRVPEQT